MESVLLQHPDGLKEPEFENTATADPADDDRENVDGSLMIYRWMLGILGFVLFGYALAVGIYSAAVIMPLNTHIYTWLKNDGYGPSTLRCTPAVATNSSS